MTTLSEPKPLLLSRLPEKLEQARNLIASLLTRTRGEYVFRIGAHPTGAKLFAGKVLNEEEGWLGTPRTVSELDTIIEETKKAVDEVGGQARSCSYSAGLETCRLIFLLCRPQYSSIAGRNIRERHCFYDYLHLMSLRRRRFAAR